MKIRIHKLRLARIISMILTVSILFSMVLPGISFAYTEKAATINATSLNVRSGPGTNYGAVGKLTQGTGVTVTGESNGADGKLWYQIRFEQGGQKAGYVLGSYLKFPVAYKADGNFEAYLNAQGFPESYKNGLRQLHAQYPNWVFQAQHTNLDWNTVIQNQSIVGRNLVSSNSISSWKSIADGAYNWDSSTWPGFDSSSWVAASEDIIRYYMDPRNFFDETYVFQFLLHTFDSTAQTRDGLVSLVKGSFLEGAASGTGGGASSNDTSTNGGGSSGGSAGPGGEYGPGVNNSGNSGNSGGNSGGSDVIGTEAPTRPAKSDVKLEGPTASISKKNTAIVATSYGPGATTAAPGDSQAPVTGGGNSYVDMIMNAGSQTGVNPYVLAAMIIQEQGTNGSSGSISGMVSGYEGYYNFFNIEAYQSGSMTPVQRGLWYASQSGSYGRPWNSVDKSISGGATFYGNTYVKAGQDTFYLKKYNVQGSNLYKHQYMTNVQGAAGEGAKLSKAYSQMLKQSALEFKIPVYTNMPENPSTKPAGDGSPNNKLRSLSVDGFSITPTFSKDTAGYDLIVDPSVTSIYIQAAPIDSGATVSGTGAVTLSADSSELKISVKAQNGSVREYTLRVSRQQNGQAGASNGASPGGPQAGPGDSGSNPGGSDVIVVP